MLVEIPSRVRLARVIVFGAGRGGGHFILNSALDLVEIFDNDGRLHGSRVHGISVSRPRKPRDTSEAVVITSGAAGQILEQLISLGWTRDAIWIPPKSALSPHILAEESSRRELAQALSRISSSLANPLVLMGGAALGCARQGDFIPWDGDVDMAVSMEDWEILREAPGIIWRMDERSRIGELNFDTWEIPISAQLFNVGAEVFIDHGLTAEPLIWPIEMFSRPKGIPVHGKRLYIPNPPAIYLETVYGEDWATPNPSFTEADYPLRDPQP